MKETIEHEIKKLQQNVEKLHRQASRQTFAEKGGHKSSSKSKQGMYIPILIYVVIVLF